MASVRAAEYRAAYAAAVWLMSYRCYEALSYPVGGIREGLAAQTAVDDRGQLLDAIDEAASPTSRIISPGPRNR